MHIPINWPWTITALFLLLPWLALGALGGIWLWQNSYLEIALLISAGFYGIIWLISLRLKKQFSPLDLPLVQPDAHWSPAGEAAWAKVEQLAETVDPTTYPLNDNVRLLQLAKQVIGDVARHFRPKAEQAEFDVPLRNILFIAEQVCRDVRTMLDENVPFSHLLTIDNGLQIWKWKQRLENGHFAYRMGMMVFSPLTAIPRELSGFFFGKVKDYPLGMLERWLLQTLVRKTGYYAISLYSGQIAPLRLAAPEPESKTPPIAERPLRILVAGQLKAGKSSLINALFDELRAPTDVLPLTSGLTQYRPQRDDIGKMLVYDTPGYGDTNRWFAEDAQLGVGDFDLILLVCSATQADCTADAQFLSELRKWFDARPARRMPPILLILTHIDQLRPLREWQPPYDIAEPQNEKARNIREVLEYRAEALQTALENCLAVCLKSQAIYNIDNVWRSIADKLPESFRAHYLRCVSEGKEHEKWTLARKQLLNTGRLVVDGLKKIKR